MLSSRRAIFLSMILFAALGPRAHAALGDDMQTIEVDRAAMKGIMRSKAASAAIAARYAVHEFQTQEGTVVREYVSPQGKVFGVAWRGPFMPNLQQIFGKYFVSFRNGERSKLAHHGRLTVTAADLVVESAGRPRAFRGRAYVTSLVPAGTAPDEIQ
jgi:Protein of unknown function (DUF2844)